MRYNLLGQTGLYVSELCLGTMTFGGRGDVWSKMGDLGQNDQGRDRCRHQFHRHG
jgi:aryl-alcohol dehydrogenase-like predicted oxidoreductase